MLHSMVVTNWVRNSLSILATIESLNKIILLSCIQKLHHKTDTILMDGMYMNSLIIIIFQIIYIISWDFFGTENGDDYRAELYLARIGPQMQTVSRMIEQAGHYMEMKKLLERSAAEVLLLLGALVAIFVYQMYKLTMAPSTPSTKKTN
jgi:hypothetical protein